MKIRTIQEIFRLVMTEMEDDGAAEAGPVSAATPSSTRRVSGQPRAPGAQDVPKPAGAAAVAKKRRDSDDDTDGGAPGLGRRREGRTTGGDEERGTETTRRGPAPAWLPGMRYRAGGEQPRRS